VLAVLAVTRTFGVDRRPAPAAPVPAGQILYGVWNAQLQESRWFTVRPDGSEMRDLHTTATCAVWWPDGSRILITNDAAVRPGRPLRPATIDPDGANLHPLDATPNRDLNLGCGGVSPDGARLALEGFADRHSNLDGIYTVRASDGGDLVRLTSGHDGRPSYSPDGSQVAFFRSGPGVSPPGAGAIFVVGADGTGLRRITPRGFAFLGQTWSPDGRWILFQRPYGELYLVHPDGTGLHPIPLRLPSGDGALNPSWSRDGTTIAFSLARNGRADIYTVRPDGTGLRRVTRSTRGNLQSPDWGG
jgi:Tol biopolymer transport system component